MGYDEEILDNFFNECDQVLFDLRSKKPIQEKSILKLVDSLNKISSIYSFQDNIPKELAAALFDMSTALYSSACSNKNTNTEDLFKLFDMFCDSARDVLN